MRHWKKICGARNKNAHPETKMRTQKQKRTPKNKYVEPSNKYTSTNNTVLVHIKQHTDRLGARDPEILSAFSSRCPNTSQIIRLCFLWRAAAMEDPCWALLTPHHLHRNRNMSNQPQNKKTCFLSPSAIRNSWKSFRSRLSLSNNAAQTQRGQSAHVAPSGTTSPPMSRSPSAPKYSYDMLSSSWLMIL